VRARGGGRGAVKSVDDPPPPVANQTASFFCMSAMARCRYLMRNGWPVIMGWSGMPMTLGCLPPCRLDTSGSADLVRLDVEVAREPRVFFGVGPRNARELLRAAAHRPGCPLHPALAGPRIP